MVQGIFLDSELSEALGQAGAHLASAAAALGGKQLHNLRIELPPGKVLELDARAQSPSTLLTSYPLGYWSP